MADATSRKNENLGGLEIVPGGVSLPNVRGRRLGRRAGPRVLSLAERDLEREMRDAFVVLKGADGTTPSRGIYAITCGDASPWRALGLRVLEAIRESSPTASIRAIGERFLAWIDRQLAALNEPKALAPGEQRLALTAGETNPRAA